MTTQTTPFFLKRLFSLLGIIPLGAFLLQHLFGNAFIFVSHEAFNEHSEFLTSLPLVYLIEIGTIYVPLFLHAGIGLMIIYRGESNFADYGYYRNWMYFLQRVTGIIALIFIITHSYTTRITSVLNDVKFTASDMEAILQNPLWFWFYLAGVLAVCFHFTNGLWSFLVTWGVTAGKKAQKAAAMISWGLFFALGTLGVAILLEFA